VDGTDERSRSHAKIRSYQKHRAHETMGQGKQIAATTMKLLLCISLLRPPRLLHRHLPSPKGRNPSGLCA
jgi:hypothetical protein